MSGVRPAIVAAAHLWLGTPYRHGASLRGVGCDCLGLVRGVWRDVIGPEPAAPPPYRPDWAERIAPGGADPLLEAAARHLRPLGREAARAGDLLLFRWRNGAASKHCAILTGPATMIHAHDGASVAEVAIVPGWRRRVAGAFAFPGACP